MEPTRSARAIARVALSRAKAAVTTIDAKMAVLSPSDVHLSANATAGELMSKAHLVHPPAFKSIMRGIKSVKAGVKASMQKANDELKAGKQQANQFVLIAEYLRHGGELSPELDPTLSQAGTVCRKSHLSGLIDATVLADSIETDAKTALEYLDEEVKRFERVRSASAIAVARQGEELLLKCSRHSMVKHTDKQLFQKHGRVIGRLV